MKHSIYLTIIILFASAVSFAQDSTKTVLFIRLPDKLLSALEKKSSALRQKLNCQTNKYLSNLQKKERKLKKKLYRKDSVLAKKLFDDIDPRYDHLKKISGAGEKFSNLYSGHLDSLNTALNFLKDNQFVKDPAVQKTLTEFKRLQEQLNTAEYIKKNLAERQEFLKEQLHNTGIYKELSSFRHGVYYYQEQIREYKQVFEDPGKLEAKLMQIVTHIPQFKNYFARNSLLSSMFRIPVNNQPYNASLQGLQTRAQLNQLYAGRFGGSPEITSQLPQNIQSTATAENGAAGRQSLLTPGNSDNKESDLSSFRPNSQKTKSFLKRLEFGTNLQSQRGRYYFPVTSDLGLSVGYKLNDNGIVGVGAAYKVGLGTGFNNISLSHQGVGLRSFLDWKLKGSLYISGGYEQNYNSLINSMEELRDHSAWTASGLVGLLKKYKAGKNIKGEMKLLWDFLSYDQYPKTQPVIFRIGYSIR